METILYQQRNSLLTKDSVGKAKPTTRKLPPDGFTFGKADVRDREDAGVVTTTWK